MGTKIQYATSALATTPTNDSFSVRKKTDDWDHFPIIGLKEDLGTTVNHKFKNSMDKTMIEQQKIESIKKTMLIHQDIFKHQVRELHRLYSVQKMLMFEMRNQETTTMEQQHRFWVVPKTTGSDHTSNYSNFFNWRHQPTTTAFSQKIHVQSVVIENNLSSCERSGSCSGDHQDHTLNIMPKMGFDLEKQQPAVVEEDQTGPTASCIAMNAYQIEKDRSEESDVELTLSIGGGCWGKNKSKIIKSEIGDQCGGSNTAVGNSSAPTVLDQQDKWLFQGLSLNRT